MFRPTIHTPYAPEILDTLLECLTRIDTILLQTNPRIPPLHHSGVRYVAEPIRSENWLSAPVVLAAGGGDCEDLCCWRAAELRLAGVRASAISVPIGFGRGRLLVHIVVRITHTDGRVSYEDPSKELGMPCPSP